MDDLEEDLRRERENSDRLAAALCVLNGSLREDESTRHIVLHGFKRDAIGQLTVGHVVDGALALHVATQKARNEL